MSDARDRRAFGVLFLGSLLLVPLPYLVAVEGCVPVVRFAMLAAISGAYAVTVDGTGVVWTLTGLLAAHALGYALALALATRLLVRLAPPALRLRLAWIAVAAGLVVALAIPIYRTPFDDTSAHARWPGLFQ